MVQLQNFENKGTVRLRPKQEQTIYCKTYKFKEHSFLCFKERGIQISKNLVIDYNKTTDGDMVPTQPFDYKDVVSYFEGIGFEVVDGDTPAGKKKLKDMIMKSKKHSDETYLKEIKGESTAIASVSPNNNNN